MGIGRAPRASLKPFVELVWTSDGAGAPPAAARRELVLPTGMTHIVLRLGGSPLRLFAGHGDRLGDTVGHALIGGARAGPYLKALAPSAPSVGALLRPGAAELMAGAPAGTLAGAHTRLEDVWGDRAVSELTDRLAGAASLAARLDLFEAALAARLPGLRGVDPLVGHALMRLGASWSVGEAVRETGVSHRHFARTFREAVGLGPKTWCRLTRFGAALDRLAREPAISWAELAVAEGYADQSHFSREFREFSGLTPGAYRRAAPAAPRHVPVSFVQDGTRAAG